MKSASSGRRRGLRFESLEPRQLLASGGQGGAVVAEATSSGQPAGVEVASEAAGEAVTGELMRWHKLTLDFVGPATSETAATNPFADYRLDVTFAHAGTGKSYVVPGYYAADGDAANTSATSGDVWRVHFAADEVGEWTYTASFRTGAGVAVAASATAGASAGFFDGDTGVFSVEETDKSGRDFRGKGRLDYVGERYLRFAGTGEYFLKQGADSPENLLAYADFDGPFPSDGQGDQRIKTWAPHIDDWKPGDPTWAGGKGKGLIGAVNYLASEGLNAFSFLPMNIAGDDRNVFPYLDYNERLRMDVSRLGQWEVVFEHATQEGMFLHFKTQEIENDRLLDNGDLGPERTLYYRELIARFGHHLALNWNLGEEITNSTTQIKDFAQYFRDTDPYDHHIVAHTYPDQQDQRYDPLLGAASELTGVSLQTNFADFRRVHSDTARWVRDSEAAGKSWAVAVDEPGDAQHALRPDHDAGDSHVDGRKNALWGTLMAGGWGNEYYFGYGHDDSDLTLQDFRSRDTWWDTPRYALEFFHQNDVPFWQMQNDNAISSAANDYGFYKAGDTYTVYLKDGGTTDLDLSAAAGVYDVRWFDPRNGGALQVGTVGQVPGGGPVNLGLAPNSPDQDWAILVRRAAPTGPNEPPAVSIPGATPLSAADGLTFNLVAQVTDDGQNHPTPGLLWTLEAGPGAAAFSDPNSAATRVTFSEPGAYRVRLAADDGEFVATSERVILAPAIQSSTDEVILAPTDDATVEGVNGINDGLLKVQASGPTRTGYLRFDVAGLTPAEIEGARLRMTVTQDPGNGRLDLRNGNSTPWTEETIAASTAPAAGAVLDSVEGTHGVGQVLEFDVGGVVDDNGQYTFVLQHAGGNDVWFSSKEGTAPPELVISRAVASTPGDYNRDVSVDQSDRQLWRVSYGSDLGDALLADGNGDGAVDAADYSLWRDAQDTAPAAFVAAATPIAPPVAAPSEPARTTTPRSPLPAVAAPLSVTGPGAPGPRSLTVASPGVAIDLPRGDQELLLIEAWAGDLGEESAATGRAARHEELGDEKLDDEELDEATREVGDRGRNEAFASFVGSR